MQLHNITPKTLPKRHNNKQQVRDVIDNTAHQLAFTSLAFTSHKTSTTCIDFFSLIFYYHL